MGTAQQITTPKPRYVVVRLTDGSTAVLPEQDAIKLFLNS